VKPTARNMARLGERATPWVMSLERQLSAIRISSRLKYFDPELRAV
jgi:hypothetical protein